MFVSSTQLVSQLIEVLMSSTKTKSLEAVAVSHFLLLSPDKENLELLLSILTSKVAEKSELLSHVAQGTIFLFRINKHTNIYLQTNHIMKGRRSRTDYLCPFVCMYVCLYPSSAHSFDPIVIKLGMDTPWDPGSDMG